MTVFNKCIVISPYLYPVFCVHEVNQPQIENSERKKCIHTKHAQTFTHLFAHWFVFEIGSHCVTHVSLNAGIKGVSHKI